MSSTRGSRSPPNDQSWNERASCAKSSVHSSRAWASSAHPMCRTAAVSRSTSVCSRASWVAASSGSALTACTTTRERVAWRSQTSAAASTHAADLLAAGVARELGQLVPQRVEVAATPVQQGEDDVGLAAEVQVEGRARRARAGRDVVDPRRDVASLGELLLSGVDQPLMRELPLRLAQRRGAGGAGHSGDGTRGLAGCTTRRRTHGRVVTAHAARPHGAPRPARSSLYDDRGDGASGRRRRAAARPQHRHRRDGMVLLAVARRPRWRPPAGDRRPLLLDVRVRCGRAPAGQGTATEGRVYAPSVVADLDGDGSREIVVGGNDGTVAAYDLRGGALQVRPGWPASTCSGGQCPETRGLAAADLDGDGRDEVVATTTNTSPSGAQVFVFDASGAPKPGWPRYNAERRHVQRHRQPRLRHVR